LDTSRTFQLLEQLVKENNGKAIQSILPSLNISIRITEKNADLYNSQLILTFLINLLIRFYPVIESIDLYMPDTTLTNSTFPRWYASLLRNSIENIYNAVQPQVKLHINHKSQEIYDIAILIGNADLNTNAKKYLFIGNNGWKAILSTDSEVVACGGINPIGAYAAAILACSEIFKYYLYPKRDIVKSAAIKPLNGKLEFSTFDYSVNYSKAPNPDLPSTLNFKKLTVIGLGAGGGAALYALSSLKNLVGDITVIDGDIIIGHNLNRYVIADKSDEGKPKVILGPELFKHHKNVTVRGLYGAFINKKSGLAKEDFEYVLATVHTREARIQIQYETPKVLWDGGATERGEFMIWRIILGKTQCMRCKQPVEENPEWKQAEVLSKVIGLSAGTIFEKRTNNDSFSKADIAKIRNYCAERNIDFQLPREGEVISDWEKNNCGRMNIPEIDEEVPIPFAPAMAGILLAGEIIKEQYFSDSVLNFQYWNSLLGVFSKHIKPELRIPKLTCSLCRDSSIIKQYNRYWNVIGER